MYKPALLSITLLFAGSALYAKPPHAEDRGHPKEKHAKKHHKKSSKHHAKNFSRADRDTIRDYYRNLPPGLAKKYRRTGDMPPGWTKKVQVGQPLPAEYERYVQPLPRELHDSVRQESLGVEVIRIGQKVLRLEKATRTILDVLEL
jgi:hypothetical protein